MELNGQSSKFFGCFAKIYGLYDQAGNIFYVGLTTMATEKRLSQHLSESGYSFMKSAKVKKIRELKKNISIKVLDILWLTNKDPWFKMGNARKLEKDWIRKYISAGIQLTNHCHGQPDKNEMSMKEDVELWLIKQSMCESKNGIPIMQ